MRIFRQIVQRKGQSGILLVGLFLVVSGCSGRSVKSGYSDSESYPLMKNSEQSDSGKGISTSYPVQSGEDLKNPKASAEYHFSMAQAYSSEGNPDRAIEEYKLALIYDPNSALIWARMASEYIKKGMLSAAMDSCKEALVRDPEFTDARLILAGLYSLVREPEEALSEYDEIIRRNPKHEEAAVFKAQVLIEEDREKEAVDSLRKFVKRNPDSAISWYYLARATERSGEYEEAVKAYYQAMEVRPGFSQAALALGVLYETQGEVQKAVALYNDSYDETQDAAIANRLATLLLKQEKYQEAVPYLEAVESTDPNNLNAKVKLGLVRMQLKQYDGAIEIFKKVLVKSPKSDRIHYYLGSLYEQKGQMDLAIQHLGEISTESSLFEDATLHVSFLFKQMGKADEAVDHIQKAIEKDSKYASFYIFRASLEEDRNNVRGAIQILEQSKSRFLNHEKLRYYLGSLYDRIGQTTKSISEMEAILKINPDNADALNYIGYTWTLQGIRLDDAERLILQALKLRPKNGYILDSWGYYLFVRGRTGEAIIELEKAASVAPNEPTILEHLGDAYARNNLQEKALHQYIEAARFATGELKQKIEEKIENVKIQIANQESLPDGSSGSYEERKPATNID